MTDLFGEFDGISAREWKQKIQFDLKGADYNESLIWQSDEGIDVKPFYSGDDSLRKLDIPLPGQPQKNSQSFFFKKTKKTLKAIEKAVNNGVDHCHIMVPEDRLDALKDFLAKLPHTEVAVLLQFERIPNDHHDSYFNALDPKNFDLDIDILGNFARTGNWYYDKITDHQLLKTYIDNPNKRSVLSVSTDLYQNAGANIIQQLGYGMAHMNEYLNHYQDGTNLTPLFKVGVGSNYFFEIAKIRALRALWRSLAEVHSVADKCMIMAIPSRRNKTIYDYNNNMIRTTLECMSAKLGGADIIQNLPYDALYHKSNDFGDRIARNQPLILEHESYFNAVCNAAEPHHQHH